MPRERRRLSPETATAWQRVARDLLAYGIATFLFIFGALEARDNVNALAAMFGAGLVLLGLPITARVDRVLRRGDEDEES